MATLSLVKSGLCLRMVNISNIAWVGCEWRPSPPLITLICGATFEAIKCAAPLLAWRMINISQCMASSVCSVSERVSPFLVAELRIFRFSTSADSLFAASSKVVRVRVLGSKNRLAIVMPRNKGIFFTARSLIAANDSA